MEKTVTVLIVGVILLTLFLKFIGNEIEHSPTRLSVHIKHRVNHTLGSFVYYCRILYNQTMNKISWEFCCLVHKKISCQQRFGLHFAN